MEMILPNVHVYAGGMFPGPAGFVALAGVKFGGYVLAGLGLRRLYPSLLAARSENRVLVWASVIWIFLRPTAESRRYLWAYASAGALWSCLLDIPAVFLLEIAPGRIPIC